jgi:hypothetical protein
MYTRPYVKLSYFVYDQQFGYEIGKNQGAFFRPANVELQEK